VISRRDSDIVASKVYFPDDPNIQIWHQSRVQHCPNSFPTNFYWYGNKQSRPGRPPKNGLKHLAAIGAEITKSLEKEGAEIDEVLSDIPPSTDSHDDEIQQPVQDITRPPQTPQGSDTCPYNLAGLVIAFSGNGGSLSGHIWIFARIAV